MIWQKLTGTYNSKRLVKQSTEPQVLRVVDDFMNKMIQIDPDDLIIKQDLMARMILEIGLRK